MSHLPGATAGGQSTRRDEEVLTVRLRTILDDNDLKVMATMATYLMA